MLCYLSLLKLARAPVATVLSTLPAPTSSLAAALYVARMFLRLLLLLSPLQSLPSPSPLLPPHSLDSKVM